MDHSPPLQSSPLILPFSVDAGLPFRRYRSKSNRHIHKGDKCGADDKEGMRAQYDQALGVLTAGTVALGSNGYDTAALELAEHAVQLLQQKVRTETLSELRHERKLHLFPHGSREEGG